MQQYNIDFGLSRAGLAKHFSAGLAEIFLATAQIRHVLES